MPIEIPTKMTKSGLEILTTEDGSKVYRQNAVVAITTVSLRRILDLFPTEIQSITANSSSDEKIENFKLKDIGATVYKSNRTWFQLRNTNNSANLWNEWVIKLKEFMQEFNIHDAPVQSLTLRIRDENLLQLAKEQGILPNGITKPDFAVSFKRFSCDGDSDRAKVTEHSLNTKLIQDHGFKYDTLNCDHVYAVQDANSVPKEKRTPIIDWKTSGVKNFFSPLPIAKRIKIHLREFGTLKFYKPGEFHKLVLARCE